MAFLRRCKFDGGAQRVVGARRQPHEHHYAASRPV
jgi:hypothetical protein